MPERVTPGDERLLTFLVPNETRKRVIDAVTIGMNGLRLDAVERMPGWRHALRNGYFVTWDAGRIAPGELVRFTVTVDVPSRLRGFTFDAAILSRGRIIAEYHPRIAIGAPPVADRGGDSALGKAALFVAIPALAVAVGAFFFALALWLRGPKPL